MKIPKRKPDFYFSLTAGYKMDGWQLDDHFVLKLLVKDEEIIVSQRDDFKDVDKVEIVYMVLKVLLDKLNK